VSESVDVKGFRVLVLRLTEHVHEYPTDFGFHADTGLPVAR
jgi:hypothetical protein